MKVDLIKMKEQGRRPAYGEDLDILEVFSPHNESATAFELGWEKQNRN